MGYDLTRFFNKVDYEFLCSVCFDVLEIPMQLSCEHTFCSECIRKWLADDESCPIDGHLLKLDLKPAAKYFSNMLDKLEIKCDFEQEGCTAVVKLANLKDHLISCEYSEVICDKGCKIKMCRREYEVNSCLSHLARKQDEEIGKLNNAITRIQDEFVGLNDELCSLQRQLKQLDTKLSPQDSNILFLEPLEPPTWLLCGMKMSIDQPNILEGTDYSNFASALSFSNLEPTKTSFKIEILNVTYAAGIGLTRKEHQFDTTPGCNEQSIGYYSNGVVLFDSKRRNLGPDGRWKVGDIIECGIEFPANYMSEAINSVDIYFTKNDQLIRKKRVKMAIDGFFPIICMFGLSCRGTKVKYLNN